MEFNAMTVTAPLLLHMKAVNPHDEIKGSSPSPCAYYEVLRNTTKPMRAKFTHWDLNAQTSTTDNHYSYA